MLIVSLLLGLNADVEWTYAASYKEEAKESSVIEAVEKEQNTNSEILEINDTETTTEIIEDNTVKNEDTMDISSEINLDTETIEETEINMDEEDSISVFQSAIEDNFQTEDGVALPNSFNDMSTGTLYQISNFEQWMRLQEYSQENDLDGYRFCYVINSSTGNTDQRKYDFTSQDMFEGLGSEKHPFAGELFSNYEVGTITLKLNKPLFKYLSSKAKIRNIKIETSQTCAGLAEYLVAAESKMETDYSIIEIGNTSNTAKENVYSGNGCAGGLFAHVLNNTTQTLTIKGNSVVVNAHVVGTTAGGLIGEITGDTTLCLTGFTLPTYACGIEGKSNAVGGLVGLVVGNEENKTTVTLTSDDDGGIVYTHHETKSFLNTANVMHSGGIFGSIKNADIVIASELTYVGKVEYDLSGVNVGGFAGCIENSEVILNASFTCQNMRITRFADETTTCNENGVGMFAGVFKNSSICVGENFNGSGSAIVIFNNPAVYNVKNITIDYNIGGLVGYAYNADLQFTQQHPCEIKNFTTFSTRGNVAGVIGYYKADSKDCQIKNIKISSTRLISNKAANANIGGLAAHVIMKDAKVTISNCSYNGNMEFATVNALASSGGNPAVSTGVAKAETVAGTEGKLTLKDIVFTSAIVLAAEPSACESYGCAIGIADTDFEIVPSGNDTVNVFDHAGNFVTPHQGSIVEYYGGLVGEIKNSSGSVRKVSIKDVAVGVCRFRVFKNAYGGLFGKVENNSAVSLAGKIYENGARVSGAYHNENGETESITVSQQNAFFATYMGKVAGEVNNALIYMEPETDFKWSEGYECNEVGNYGGVVRNGYWDKTDSNDGNLLIKEYQVQGTLNPEIDSTGDLIRFAIAMNTGGNFMPVGNKAEDALIKNIESVRSTSYTLSQEEYDLTETGLVCLGKNDDEGIKNCYFKGSFSGKNPEKTTIIYDITSYGQKNIGLFPSIVAGENGSTFEYLNLKYKLQYSPIKAYNFDDNSNIVERIPEYQNAGGIAAEAKGAINVTNVSYNGSIVDIANSQTDAENNFIEKQDSYLGGFFGSYTAQEEKTLKIENIVTNMNEFTYSDYSHVVGGVIAYVNLDEISTGTCNVNIDTVTLNGAIKINSTPDKVVRESAFISLIGDKTKTGAQYTKKCNMVIEQLKIENVLQTTESEQNYNEMGGFLGYNWTDVDVKLSNVAIGENENTELSGVASFGGLVHTVYGKMVIDGLMIGSNTTFNTKSGSEHYVENSGLLIRNGQYLYLDICNYTIASGVKLLNYNGNYFDELVGYNKGGDDASHGGILSISYSTDNFYHLGRENCEYTSYQSGNVIDGNGTAVIKNNPDTRYYYDLNKLTFPADETDGSAYAMLDSSDDILAWHLMHYANKSIRTCIDTSFNGALPSDYVIRGIIDMSGYSIYPTPVQNEKYNNEIESNNGTIVYNAQSIIDGENKITDSNKCKYPDESERQHYQMHAGLFSNVSGLTIRYLTFSGTYSKSEDTAGAVVTGSIYGIETGTDSNGKITYNETIENKFRNIELDNLWCVSSGTMDYDKPIGLLIADISSGANVSFKDIVMTGYVDNTVDNTSKQAASALIGNVGSKTATYITLTFEDMGIADAADGKSNEELNSAKKDEVLARASFIYSYNYEENCNGIYMFNYEDYAEGRLGASGSDVVTLGQELGNNGESPNYAKEEYFDKDLPVGKVDTEDTENPKEIIFKCDNYLPYVYTKDRLLLINPKAGSLTEGCGTYEDPYIIKSARQMITLYRYFHYEVEFADIFKHSQWKVNPIGDDSKLCDRTASVETGHGEPIQYNNPGFPGRTKLLSAYYQITEDIDLSEYPDLFTGFGRTSKPFTGVFVGKRKEDGNYPTVIMSKIGDTSLSDYGFIQFAKGCVVKDICVQFNERVIINKTICEGGIGAGVIATVLGGENIIDNVTVKGETVSTTEDGNVVKECFTPGNPKAVIGGYVGMVNLGGVILRNIKEENLRDFSVNWIPNDPSNYLYTCGIIGRVKDGYVVYDSDNADSTVPLFKDLTGVYNNTHFMEQSRSYNIINGSYLQNDNNKIIWTAAGTDDGNIVAGYTINNAKQLQIISMALNAGALNYQYSNNSFDGVGYNQNSRQRSGNYNYVGSVVNGENDTSYAAREAVIRYDNLNNASEMDYHSYLFKYFNLGVNDVTDSQNALGTAILNPEDSVLTYTLQGGDYDMSVYGSAFRGLGARYIIGNNVFRSNFKAPEGLIAKLKLSMIADGVHEVNDVALLNNIKGKEGNYPNLTISNIILSGEIVNKSDIGDTFTYDEGNNNAGGFVSTSKRVHLVFENVNLDQLTVKSQNYTGGMVANSSTGSVTFNNCGITSSASQKKDNDNEIFGMSVTGGFVGSADVGATINGISHLEQLYVYSGNVNTECTKGKNVGGLIGRSRGALTVKGTVEENSTEAFYGKNITVKSAGRHVQIGGLVGSANLKNNSYKFSNIALQNLTVENVFSGYYSGDKIPYEGTDGENIIGTGGIVGSINSDVSMENITIGSNDGTSKVFIRNTHQTIPNHSCYCNGGLVGRLMSDSELTLTNCKVLGASNKDGGYTTLIFGRGNTGGIAGNSNKVDGKNVTVNGVSIESARYAGGFFGWHENDRTCSLESIALQNVHIALVGEFYDDQGDIGGIVGRGQGYIRLTDAAVTSLTIDSDYCKNAGGFVGNQPRSTSGCLAIYGTNNIVKDSLICGIKVGGVVGTLGGYSEVKSYSNITIENNKLISSQERRYNNSDKTYNSYAAAGGFVGELGTNKDSTNPDCIYVEKMNMTGNLIASYDGNNTPAKLGGVIGNNYSESYFYEVSLKDNYIGMMKQNDLGDDIKKRQVFLEKTPIVESIEKNVGLRTYLYYVTDTDSNDTYETCVSKIGETTISTGEFYKYSYLQGTVVGTSSVAIPKFINVHVDYSDSNYHPVVDVGLNEAGLKSNSEMYAASRSLCAIVYDGEPTDAPTQTLKEKFENVIQSDETIAELLNNPYIFGNIDTIWENYSAENADKRTAYRLEENYQDGIAMNLEADAENLTIENIYQKTYKDSEGYKSPFKVNGETIPMVVYNSAESGTIDQVIQTYINIMTNNSGALNSYVNKSNKYITLSDTNSKIDIVNVTTYKMKLTDGILSVDSTAKNQCVIVERRTDDTSKYEFSTTDGDELTQDGDGTFTLVHVEYKSFGDNAKVKWTLDIPVYVEKRLKIYSNMTMVEGIQYDNNVIKQNGQHVLTESSTKNPMVLSRGNSYSIYAEYIYADALDKFQQLKVPKLFYIETEAAVSFVPGTKITMISLEEKGKPYYYEVTEADGKQIDFAKFKDADGKPYALQDIKSEGVNTWTEYPDLCGKEHTDVVVERYVLLVDTSNTTGDKNNALYEMHISPKELWTNDGNSYYNSILSSRTDYNEHCYEYVNEIDGISYVINKEIDDNNNKNTYLEETSKISKGCKVTAHLQYDIKANQTYWDTYSKSETLENVQYLDIGFYLAVNEDNNITKVPLPSNTIVSYGKENATSAVVNDGQVYAYYYQGKNNGKEISEQDYICISDLSSNKTGTIDITFDFSNADMSELEAYYNSTFYVGAELVVTQDKELPAAGEVKDTWSESVDSEAANDIGFALEVKDLMTLGMNQYNSEVTDSGVVPYTASFAFSDNSTIAEKKYYTIVYQIEEKQKNGDGTTSYATYKGNDVSLYLGNLSDAQSAVSGSDPINSGKGITAVTYKFSTDNIKQGADLQDGMTPLTESEDKAPGVIKTHCTLIANCSDLNMTNYRVKAFLIISDEIPTGTDGVIQTTVGDTGNTCLKGYTLRSGDWSELSSGLINEDTKNDFFVFTVAKIKTSMQ